MESIYDKLSEFIEADETVAVATIIDVKGSVPREVGAKMIIHPLGRHVGTIGGGCGEADVIKAALDVIQTGEPATVRVDLTEDISMKTLGVCGGIMDVFVERAMRETEDERPKTNDPRSFVLRPSSFVPTLLVSIRAREPVALATVIDGPNAGRDAVVWLDRPPLGTLGLGELEPRIIADSQEVLRGRQHKLLKYDVEVGGWRFDAGGWRLEVEDASNSQLPASSFQSPTSNLQSPISSFSVFVEVQRRAPELLIVGAGHIAMPLAQIAGLCDFSVTVLDDRPSFASQARFPTARQVIAAPLRETVRDLPMDADTFIVLVTRGHSQDVECLLEVLDRPVAYIGMIGSQRRVDAVFELLETEMGMDPVKFDRVYAPIGIAIGARSPAEIAVCITAEMINVLRGGPATSISEKRRERNRRRRERASGRIAD